MLAKKRSETDIQAESYRSFFDLKISELYAKGVKEKYISLLQKQEDQLINMLLQIDLPDQKYPFLPVFPFSFISISEQFKLIKDPRGDDRSDIDIDKLEDVVKTFSKPYFIIGIDEGDSTENQHFSGSIVDIQYENKLFLSLAEVFSVAINTDVFEEINLWAIGSVSDGLYPLLKTNGIGPVKTVTAELIQPEMILSHAGIPSCRKKACFL